MLRQNPDGGAIAVIGGPCYMLFFLSAKAFGGATSGSRRAARFRLFSIMVPEAHGAGTVRGQLECSLPCAAHRPLALPVKCMTVNRADHLGNGHPCTEQPRSA